VLPSAVEIIIPVVRPSRPVPFAALAVLVGSTTASLALHPGASHRLLIADLATKGIAMAAACRVFAWVEGRSYEASINRSAIRRVVLAVLMPLVSAAFAIVLLYGVYGLRRFVHDDGTLLLTASAGSLWLISAAFGSLVVVLLDVAPGSAALELPRRVKLALFSLIPLGFGVGAALFRAARHAPGLVPSLDPGRVRSFLYAEVAAREELLVLVGRSSPAGRVIAAIAAGVLFVVLPAVSSVCGKLTEGALQRLSPFLPAFEAVSSGRLDVLLDESKEFTALSGGFNDMVESLAIGQRADRALSVYSSREISNRVRAQHGRGGTLPSTRREATVFFVEVRGLLSFSEVIAPTLFVEVLNRYFERALAVLDRHHGYLEKFVGEAFVVVFNGPIDQADHAERGTRCAIDLQQQTAEMNRAGLFAEIGKFTIAIGVATGPVISGNIGGGARAQYGVLGEPLEVASRLTGLAPPGHVWVNQATADRLPDDLPTVLLAAYSVRGKAVPLVPCRVWPP
jgi:class 3 adenylate cyclase